MRPTVARVYLDRVYDNVQWVKSQLNPHVSLMAVVKADGYGHGAEPVARTALAAGAESLGVALVEEGITLRNRGIRVPILVLGQVPFRQIAEAVDHDLELVVFDPETFDQALSSGQKGGKPVRVHIKIDTGMGRIGMRPDNFDDEWIERLRRPGVIFQGLMTHFAKADVGTDQETAQQTSRFLDVIERCRKNGMAPNWIHAANSAATLRFPGTQFNLVRLGIAMYGLKAYKGMSLALKPALELTSEVVFVKEVGKGFAVGYGGTYITPEAMKIATIPIGYADGYRRGLSNKAHVLIRGRAYPVIGRVSMDQLNVGVRLEEGVEVGDPVVLIGSQGEQSISADQLADLLDTIGYEIVTGLSARIPRVYGN